MSYADTQANVLAILSRKGQAVTRTTNTPGAYDPATGTSTPSTADTTRKGVLLPFNAGVMTVRGVMVEAEDQQLYLDATAAVDINDKFTVNSKVYTAVSFEEYSPAGTAVMYVIHLRKA